MVGTAVGRAVSGALGDVRRKTEGMVSYELWHEKQAALPY